MTIGSIGGGASVNNVTFRNAYMHNTFKGIYLKFNSEGSITNILYENITIDSPNNWPIWIGPA